MSETPNEDIVPRPWRTDFLPELVGFAEAVEILGIEKSTLRLWMQPGSGPHGPDGTRMITPQKLRATPVWVRADVERFKAEFGTRRRRPSRGE